jgi:hypothetical protein
MPSAALHPGVNVLATLFPPRMPKLRRGEIADVTEYYERIAVIAMLRSMFPIVRRDLLLRTASRLMFYHSRVLSFCIRSL